MKHPLTSAVVVAAIIFVGAPLALGDTTVSRFEQQLTLSNACAVFNVEVPGATPDTTVTRIVYGEDIPFSLRGAVVMTRGLRRDGGGVRYEVSVHGEGVGATSGVEYRLTSRGFVRAATNGLDPSDPLFKFDGTFRLDGRIIGEAKERDHRGPRQAAQDNLVVRLVIGIHIAGGSVKTVVSGFSMECSDSPWTNQMDAPVAGDRWRTPVGRGFGDPWNKYAWSMKDFGGGMVVGTKSAYYDVLQEFNPTGAVKTCVDSGSTPNPMYQVTSIHLALACMELFGAPVSADNRPAAIWRFDYTRRNWTKQYEDGLSQGFRVMAVHNGKLYAGSDLGAFITGVDLHSGGPGHWNFPGSKVLVSTDGKSFQPVASCVGPCNSTLGADNPYGLVGSYPNYTGAVNTSIRAMASYNGKLYVGTFNVSGAQLWSYDDSADTWALVYRFGPPAISGVKPAIGTLRVFNDKLYIGLAGPAGNNYLYEYAGTGVPVVVPGLPSLDNANHSNVGVLTLFTSTDPLLYIGTVDLSLGFTLQTYDGSTFRTITSDGFGNAQNAYAWSMAEVNGRVFVGTFNQAFEATLPRGSAELWYTDDGNDWQQMALPLEWGVWNYGIRTMEVGNRMLFLGSASNMIAPDTISVPFPIPFPVSPGAEVWAIRANAAAPPWRGIK